MVNPASPLISGTQGKNLRASKPRAEVDSLKRWLSLFLGSVGVGSRLPATAKNWSTDTNRLAKTLGTEEATWGMLPVGGRVGSQGRLWMAGDARRKGIGGIHRIPHE